MPDTAPTNAADVLERAADVIVKRGWCQHAWVDVCGHVCVAEALHLAAESDEERRPSWAAFSAYLRAPLTNWNDREGRTGEQVIAALRECGAELRAAS